MDRVNHITAVFFIVIIFTANTNSTKIFAQSSTQIAITIDDLPTLSHGLLSENEQYNYFIKILDVLEKFEVKTVGFVVGNKVDSLSMELLTLFTNKGHSLGNHTYNHYDLNKIETNAFIEDIRKCDSVLNLLSDNSKYFRYPMLHRGNEKQKKEKVLEYLEDNNYTIVPVSIDTDETTFNIEFVKAFKENDTTKMKEIGERYVQHMIDKSLFYEDMAVETNNKPIKQILLTHMNLINSYYLKALLQWYKSNNWSFIRLDDALKDPFYSIKDKYIGRKGLSYIERVYNN